MKIEANTADTFLVTLYLAGVTVAALVGKMVIKFFKFVTPYSTKIVTQLVKDWIVDLLKPAIDDAIEKKLGSHINELIALKETAHNAGENSKIILSKITEVLDKIEQKIEKDKL